MKKEKRAERSVLCQRYWHTGGAAFRPKPCRYFTHFHLFPPPLNHVVIIILFTAITGHYRPKLAYSLWTRKNGRPVADGAVPGVPFAYFLILVKEFLLAECWMGSKMVVVYSSGVILSPLGVSGFPARLLYTSSALT